MGQAVRDPDDRHIGDNADLILDPLSGRVAFVIVALSHAADRQDRFLPLPWSALQGADEKGFRVAVSSERVARAPVYSAVELGELSRRRSGVDIFAFYGLQPPWDRSPPGETVSVEKERTQQR